MDEAKGTGAGPVIGFIGGSGVYDLEGLRHQHWVRVDSPFGDPSDELLFGDLDGQPLVFLPRHGRGHRIPPSAINYRANIDAMKRAGVTDLVSVSAVGSLREELRPGAFVIVDQFIDRTFARTKSFFGPGLVAHVSMAHPVCQRLGDHLEAAARAAGIEAVRGGTYLVMEGPQFSTLAESRLYRSWGCDVIGMTNMPEAKLAREAELCYATVAMVTDYDCWQSESDLDLSLDHDGVHGHAPVTVDAIVQVLLANADRARSLAGQVAARLGADPQAAACPCRRALEHALITAPGQRDPALLQHLDAVAGRLLNPPQA